MMVLTEQQFVMHLALYEKLIVRCARMFDCRLCRDIIEARMKHGREQSDETLSRLVALVSEHALSPHGSAKLRYPDNYPDNVYQRVRKE
jgi:hypothetical protein